MSHREAYASPLVRWLSSGPSTEGSRVATVAPTRYRGGASRRMSYRSNGSRNEELEGRISYTKSRVEKATKIALRDYEDDVGIGGFNVTAIENTLETLTNLPQIARNRNLYYVMMPSRVGKSYYSKKYGLVDVDCCVGVDERAFLVQAIQVLSDVKSGLAQQVAMSWVSKVRACFKCLEFSGPTVVLVHDDLTGYLIGASKLGGANLPLDTKLSRAVGSDMKKLVRINDKLFHLNQDKDTFDSDEELERWLVSRLRSIGMNINDVSGVEPSRLDGMVLSGRISKEDADRKVRAMADQDGYGYTNNDWCMALSVNQTVPNCPVRTKITVDMIKDQFDCMRHVEIMKILSNDKIEDWDKVIRIVWWEVSGIHLTAKKQMLRILQNLPSKNVSSVMRWIGNIVAKSRYVLDVRSSLEERQSILDLVSAYNVNVGKLDDFGELAEEEKDRKFRVGRTNMDQRNRKTMLSPQIVIFLEEAYGISGFDGSILGLSVVLKEWSTLQVCALLEVVRDQEIIDKMHIPEHMASVMRGEILRMTHMYKPVIRGRLGDLMDASPTGAVGLIGKSAKKGIRYLIDNLNGENEEDMCLLVSILGGELTESDDTIAVEMSLLARQGRLSY